MPIHAGEPGNMLCAFGETAMASANERPRHPRRTRSYVRLCSSTVNCYGRNATTDTLRSNELVDEPSNEIQERMRNALRDEVLDNTIRGGGLSGCGAGIELRSQIDQQPIGLRHWVLYATCPASRAPFAGFESVPVQLTLERH